MFHAWGTNPASFLSRYLAWVGTCPLLVIESGGDLGRVKTDEVPAVTRPCAEPYRPVGGPADDVRERR
ncbi:hypothetical protein Tcur_4127 [Thermomonospora curvata DSM 43183]|uniref:Uncharacterized protein n=1 Tax=Thermomonospora curvata (strain ATCC 19995 / DSM 43183 / JCM 3096 / KCTC 9072 / NBRC 15933 / NCIMB 10081 / Henssen B9) TaxID=471852 RepID=D1A202_THECD|nr:hypothetical protein Tcur_4127 [Thermomonospora curvata DSM 43183]